MTPNEHAPEWADYAQARYESMRTKPPVRDSYWNGTNWSERPDPSEYMEEER